MSIPSGPDYGPPPNTPPPKTPTPPTAPSMQQNAPGTFLTPLTPGSGGGATAQVTPGVTSYEDPTGAWQKFLGPTASPQDVEMFFRGLLKFFNILIQQSDAAQKRAMAAQKAAIEGDAPPD